MKKGWIILTIFCMASLMNGCKSQEILPPVVVTRVEILCIHDGEQIHRNYVEEEQIRTVLDCLRLQKSKGTAQVDPERVVGDVFEIRVGMSNGSEHIYRHRGGCYLSKDSHPWQLVDPEQGKALYTLLWEVL